MDDLRKKFSEAAKIISSRKNPMPKSVYCAYVDHLSDINTEDLPQDIQIIYESVDMRINSAVSPGDIPNVEAGYLAKDILYMAEVLKTQHQS